MVEALVACALVLVPLFLAIPVLAKYLDIRTHVVEAARYAAWERTVWFGGDAAATMKIGNFSGNQWDANAKSDAAIHAEIGHRILTRNGGGFSTTADKSSSGAINQQTLWQDRQGNSLLKDYSDVSGTYGNDTAPGFINDILDPLLKVASLVSSFTLDTHAQYTAAVDLSVKEVAFNADRAGLGPCANCPVDFTATTGRTMTFSERNVLVANGWSANGPGSLAEKASHPERINVYNQIRGLTPTSILKPADGVFKGLMDVLQAISLVFFPELSTLDLGRIQPDQVPADRLQ